MDLKNILQEQEHEISQEKESNSSVDSETRKKPIQLVDIENRSNNTHKEDTSNYTSDYHMKQLLEKERENSYKNTWSKLDRGMKINRIKVFIQEESERNDLTEKHSKDLEIILLKNCKEGKLNKNTEITYDDSIGRITKINKLTHENGVYTLGKMERKKSKNTSKSRSNIDRFLK